MNSCHTLSCAVLTCTESTFQFTMYMDWFTFMRMCVTSIVRWMIFLLFLWKPSPTNQETCTEWEKSPSTGDQAIVRDWICKRQNTAWSTTSNVSFYKGKGQLFSLARWKICFHQRKKRWHCGMRCPAPALHITVVWEAVQLQTSQYSVHKKWARPDEKTTTAWNWSVPQGGLPPSWKWWFCPHTSPPWYRTQNVKVGKFYLNLPLCKGWPKLVLESHSSAEFCSNLNKNSPVSSFVILIPWLAC